MKFNIPFYKKYYLEEEVELIFTDFLTDPENADGYLELNARYIDAELEDAVIGESLKDHWIIDGDKQEFGNCRTEIYLPAGKIISISDIKNFKNFTSYAILGRFTSYIDMEVLRELDNCFNMSHVGINLYGNVNNATKKQRNKRDGFLYLSFKGLEKLNLSEYTK